MPSIAALRHAPWSLSKIKCALRCPLEFGYRYVDKIPEPEVAPDARIGKAIHAALEALMRGTPEDEAQKAARQVLLTDDERQRFDALALAIPKFSARISGFRKSRRIKATLIEHRLAINSDLAPTGFGARDAFYRGVWDLGFLFDDGCLAIVDHKTGARHELSVFADQLEGYAVLARAHLCETRKFWLGVHFVGEATVEWRAPMDLALVRDIAPRLVAQMEDAARAVGEGFQPKPTTWCARCSYRSMCPTMR